MGHVRLHYVGFHGNSPAMVAAMCHLANRDRLDSSWVRKEIVNSPTDYPVASLAILSCSPDSGTFVTRKIREVEGAISFRFDDRAIHSDCGSIIYTHEKSTRAIFPQVLQQDK